MSQIVRIPLALAYHLKEGEEANFWDSEELAEVNRQTAEAIERLKPQLRNEPRIAHTIHQVRESYFKPKRPTWGPRVSSFLLREAIGRKFKGAMPREDGKDRPGVWWGDIVRQLNRRVDILELTPPVAAWLLRIWQDPDVQNTWPPPLQQWVNVLDRQMNLTGSSKR
jgi:hypothetical protein